MIIFHQCWNQFQIKYMHAMRSLPLGTVQSHAALGRAISRPHIRTSNEQLNGMITCARTFLVAHRGGVRRALRGRDGGGRGGK